MNYRKSIKVLLFVFFACALKLKAQENKLFNEYLACFTEIYLTDEFQDCNLIEPKFFIPDKFSCFFDKEIYESWDIVNSWFFCKIDNLYCVAIRYAIEDEYIFDNNRAYYYFIFYDELGKVINSYKLLRSTDQQWFEDGVNYDSKLFLSKNEMMYFLYGAYRVPEMEANCLEEIYEIKNNGSLEKISEKNYKARKVDEWNW
jgi:hypothetical protein